MPAQQPPGMPATEDWAAVAKAINQRQAELALTQRQLIDRSKVSKAVVHEIQHNVARRRGSRTLEALSVALGWHPHHLFAVLEGREPPEVQDPAVATSGQDVPSRMAIIERQLREIIDRLDRIEAIEDRLDQIRADLSAMRRIDRLN